MKNIYKTGVQIQIKPIGTKKGSRSFTVKNITVDEAYARTEFLFEQLEKTNDQVEIIHYKRRQEDETAN